MTSQTAYAAREEITHELAGEVAELLRAECGQAWTVEEVIDFAREGVVVLSNWEQSRKYGPWSVDRVLIYAAEEEECLAVFARHNHTIG